MKERLRQSAKSSNFWNNISNIGSLGILVLLIVINKDNPDSMKDMILAYMGSSLFHNGGNILSHMNKD